LKNRVVLLKEHLISNASVGIDTQVDNVKVLHEWFNGTNETLKAVELGLNNKWAIVKRLYRWKHLDKAQKRAAYDIVAELDKTDTAKSILYYCDAVVADHEEMKKYWESFLDEKNTESVKVVGAQMSGFNSSIHEHELEKYQPLFFEVIQNVFGSRNKEYAKDFFDSLFPHGDHLNTFLDGVKHVLSKTKEDEKTLVKNLSGAKDDLERRIRCHECLAKYLSK